MRHITIHPKTLLLLAILWGVAAACLAPGNTPKTRAASRAYYVDSENGNDSNPGTLSRPWQSLGKVSGYGFAPGDRVYLKRGSTWKGEYLFIGVTGTAENPIVYETYGSGTPPKIQEGSINIDGASYVTVRGMEVTGSPYAGVVLQNGAQHVTVSDNILHHNAAGVWMGNGTGMENRIISNTVYLNTGNGIVVDSVFCTPGSETIIAYNEVYSNTWHGIELSANYHIIEGNRVYGNGANPDGSDDMVGHSGIHLFSRYHEDDPDQGGDHNIIRGNIVYDTRDRNAAATDGNGIQMDMWCDDNQVYNNIAYHNDGPGVIVYGGSRNQIFHNTLYDNGLHLGIRWAQTQVMVASSDEVAAEDNTVVNNIAFSLAPQTFAVFIGDDAKTLNNVFAGNLYFNAAAGNLTGRGSEGAVSLATWNAASWADDLGGNPLFVDAPAYDFHLSPASPAVDAGQAAPWVSADFEGEPRPCPSGGAFDIGADEVCASDFSIFLPLLSRE